MTALATLEELAAYRGVDLADLDDDASTLGIELASGLVRDFLGQSLTYVEDDVVELLGIGGRILRLPELPVHDVTLVEVRTGTDYTELVAGTDYEVVLGTGGRRAELWRLGRDWPNAARARAFGGMVRVTYSHGYATPGDQAALDAEVARLPEAIRVVVLRSATRSALNPDGIRSESIGAYSVQFAGDTTTGGFTPVVVGGPYLSNLDERALAPWRP